MINLNEVLAIHELLIEKFRGYQNMDYRSLYKARMNKIIA